MTPRMLAATRSLSIAGTLLGVLLGAQDVLSGAPRRLTVPRPASVAGGSDLSVPANRAGAGGPPQGGADSLARAITARNLFREGRVPATVGFNPDAPAGAPPAAAPRTPRPQLVLVGVVLGREPVALINGLPGAEGTRVLKAGERFGDYVVRTIAQGGVVVAGADTTWTLRVRTQFP